MNLYTHKFEIKSHVLNACVPIFRVILAIKTKVKISNEA